MGTRQSRRLIVWAGGFAEGRARYVATSSTSHNSPLPSPLSFEELDACFVVRDHNGQQLDLLLRLAFLEAVDCHNGRPYQGRARHHHEKRYCS
jgi:hypothetical protein